VLVALAFCPGFGFALGALYLVRSKRRAGVTA
jgi:hypothetical protein